MSNKSYLCKLAILFALFSSFFLIADTLSEDRFANRKPKAPFLLFPREDLATTSPLRSPHTDSESSVKNLKLADIKEEKENGNIGVNQPPLVNTKYISRLSFEENFLYWKAGQEGLEFAIKTDNSQSFFQPAQQNKGTVKNPRFAWNPAFRLGLGFHLPHDYWDLNLIWTRYRSDTRKTVRAGEGSVAINWFQLATFDLHALKAIARWDLNYDTLDFTLSHGYFVSRALGLTPYFGLRGALIHQHAKFHYIGSIDDGSLLAIQQVHLRNNFNSLGIRGGLGLNFYFSSQWSLVGSLSGSLLYGKYNLKERYTSSLPTVQGNPSFIQDGNEIHRLRANLEGLIGIQWEMNLYRKYFHFKVFFGYEMLYWFNQLDLTRFFSPGFFNGFTYSSSGNNLTLQGGTFSLKFDF